MKALTMQLLLMARFLGCLGAIGLALPVHAAERSGERWALLVGVNDYNQLNDLEYCAADMQALRDQLVSNGFSPEHIVLMNDRASDQKLLPFKGNIEQQLDLLLGRLEEDDLVVLAFSGHGVHLDGASYLCPKEANLDRAAGTLISLPSVYERLEKCGASLKLLLIDACRNDPRPGGQKSAVATKDSTAFAGSLERPPSGILLLASCAPGQISVEEKKFGHGVFMEYLLEGLQGKADTTKAGNGDGKVSLLEMYRYASDQTKNYVATAYNSLQTPVLKGEITNDFDIGSKIRWDKIIVPDDFKTIRQAMDVASDGTTILVQPGRYEEAIFLKSGVKLFGADKEKVVISSKDNVFWAKDCRSGEVRNMTFEGQRFDEDHFFSLVALENSRVLVADCLIRSEDKRRFGVTCGSGDKSTVSRCQVEMCSDGIYVENKGTHVVLQNNTCERNEYHGIQVRGGGFAEVRFCICRGNKQDGIFVNEENSSAELSDNTCENNQAQGIEATESARLTARNNHCNGNQCAGIYIHAAGTRGELVGNECRNNTLSGIEINAAANLEASHNHCENNKGSGILAQSGPVTLTSNICRFNTIDGIAFERGATGTIKDNRCDGNTAEGVAIRGDKSNAVIENNECNSNDSCIGVYDKATATVKKNHCSRARHSGLEAHNCGIRAEDNTFENNSQCAVMVIASNVVLLRNDCLSSAYSGISMKEGSTGEIRGNRLHNNIWNGLWFDRRSSATGENDNSFRSNGQDAIYHSTE